MAGNELSASVRPMSAGRFKVSFNGDCPAFCSDCFTSIPGVGLRSYCKKCRRLLAEAAAGQAAKLLERESFQLKLPF